MVKERSGQVKIIFYIVLEDRTDGITHSIVRYMRDKGKKRFLAEGFGRLSLGKELENVSALLSNLHKEMPSIFGE
jgi:hypothetical protein